MTACMQVSRYLYSFDEMFLYHILLCLCLICFDLQNIRSCSSLYGSSEH